MSSSSAIRIVLVAPLYLDLALVDLVAQPCQHVLNRALLLPLHALVERARICDHFLKVEVGRVLRCEDTAIHGLNFAAVERFTDAQGLCVLWILEVHVRRRSDVLG